MTGNVDKLKKRLETDLTKKLGEGVVVSLLASQTGIKRWYPTQLPPLDVILSGKVGRGFPAGRLVELFGYESVGKTTLGMSLIAAVQREGVLGCMIDTESRFTWERAKTLGIDVDKLICLEEEYLEPILDALILITESAKKTPTVIFWDTVAGTPSARERGGNVKEAAMGVHAKALSKGMRVIIKTIARSNVLLIACNQLKDGAIGQMFASDYERDATLGGRAIRFHADIRVKLTSARRLWGQKGKNPKKIQIGFETVATVVKNTNRVANGSARLVFLYERGGRYDPALSCLRTLQTWGRLKASKNGRVEFAEKKLTESGWRSVYTEDEKFRERVHEALEVGFAATYLPDDTEEES